jgi:hypothetical protein
LQSGGSIVAWGTNTYGQCNVPAPNEDFVAIAACDWHSLGLKSDGTVVAWGRDSVGQSTVPTPNAAFFAIAAGANNGRALRNPGVIHIADHGQQPGSGSSGPPTAIAITAVAPNPFNPQITVRYEVPRPTVATLRIYDLSGRLVRSIWNGALAAGRHEAHWDGQAADGAPAAAGVYLVRLVTSAGAARAAKVTLAK